MEIKLFESFYLSLKIRNANKLKFTEAARFIIVDAQGFAFTLDWSRADVWDG